MIKLAIDGGLPVITQKLPSITDRSGRLIGDEELAAVKEVLETGNLAYIYGTQIGKFEKEFARLFGSDFAVATSSGTAALHTALVYLNPEPGDEVLVSPITDMGCIIPILYQQAIPVFVDIDPKTQNINPNLLEEQISPRTRAIMVTHIFGNPADMDPIIDIARKYDLFIIEDAAQAHRAEYKKRLVGSIGNLGCFSFQQSKHITTGDGGMVISNEDTRFGRSLRHCHDKGWPREKSHREHIFLAPNYHMTELQAAIGLAQIAKYPISIGNRQKAALELDNLLAGYKDIQSIKSLPNCKHTYFHFCIRFNLQNFKVGGGYIVKALEAEGLSCELGYPGTIPLYLYSMIRDKKTFGTSGWPFNSSSTKKKWIFNEGLCPEAEKACLETVVLPWNEGFKSEHVQLIAEAILKVYNKYHLS